MLVTIDASVSEVITKGRPGMHSNIFTPYGYTQTAPRGPSVLAFNGELLDLRTGHYYLGNGHRQFNPSFLRFLSPDSLSPFSSGGLSSYAYCLGNPINYVDSNGRTSFFRGLMKALSTFPEELGKTVAETIWNKRKDIDRTLISNDKHYSPLNAALLKSQPTTASAPVSMSMPLAKTHTYSMGRGNSKNVTQMLHEQGVDQAGNFTGLMDPHRVDFAFSQPPISNHASASFDFEGDVHSIRNRK
ncbi:RHS repeat-associated core domain-containing protein [Pseudomonas kermanshahensis]|uniref:RHS repeat-associated core domain-containing protein n=1 Tax=Pseudomonas kermanshahensis TaxID=2745482 RepID=UPI0023DB6CF0|nr:RHS repeat-associated core domain-containing protein [Pseudomonas kermanshahensis]WEL54098.1 RHS repeat-associated core domain-containing protein [Pseudomonas kermanshahensis]